MTSRPTTATILVVDDNPASAGALADILKPDFRVVTAHDGYSAIRLVCSGQAPDLVLVDVDMPGMDGYETCRELQSRRPTETVPIIFVTCEGDPSAEARALELGAVDCIVKPVSPMIVRARVRSHLRVHRRTSMLHDLIGSDPLTGIANRRRFDEALEAECRRCERANVPLSVVFIDVDYFKCFGDTFGHDAGDECLRSVARALNQELSRPGDLVARYGGEEFVALLPETDQQGAKTVAHRFRNAVEHLGVPNPASAVEAHVTISVGTVTAAPDQLLGAHRDILKAADRVLYQAKETGRNRVAQGDYADHSHLRPPGEPFDKWEESGVRTVHIEFPKPLRVARN